MKTIKGICDFYSVRFFIPLEQGIAVYNCANDDFHVFRWSSDNRRYILESCQEYIPNWTENRMGI